MFPIQAGYDYPMTTVRVALSILVSYLVLGLSLRLTANRHDGRFRWRIGCFLAKAAPTGSAVPRIAAFNDSLSRFPEHREREQKHREGEEYFRRIFEHAPCGMCVIGFDKRFLQVNRAICMMLGYSGAELAGTSWVKLTHKDDIADLLQKFEQLTMEPGGCLEVEKRLTHRSGAVVWASMRIGLVRDTGGSPLHFVVQIKDISERNRTVEALRSSEAQYHTIADSCPSMMWATDANGSIQFLNRACRLFSGMNCDEVDGSKWQLLIHPDDAPEYVTSFGHAMREHIPFSAETRIQRADGKWRLLGSRAEPSFSSKGEYLGHIGLSADITDRIQAERTRQFELSLIHSIHEGSLDGILVVNGNGMVVSRNKRFLDIWKISSLSDSDRPFDTAGGVADSLILSKIIERVEDPEAFLRRVKELYEDPEANDHCEIQLRDARTLERDSTSLRNEKGAYLGRVWFFRDITARKREQISLENAKLSADEANRRLLSERSILESERKMLRALIDNIPDSMYVKDSETRFVVANSCLARLVGAETPEQLLGKTDFDLFPPQVARAFFEDDRNVMRSGQALHNREEKGVDCAGNETHSLTTKVPLRDSNGQVVGIAGVGRDITVRKKMEDALREAERKYRGIFDNAVIGIFQSTLDGRFLNLNAAMAADLGYDSPEEMIASIADISGQFYVDPKRRDAVIGALNRLGGVQNFECEAFRRDGSKIWVSMSIRAIHQNGVLARFEGMCEDITERIVLREQLVQAQKLESVGQLAAGIAHEINTPTQYIGDNVRFLKDAFRDLKSLMASCERLAQDGTPSIEAIHEVSAEAERADVPYLLEEIPKAIDQTLEGVTRVATLVSAMKEFSHPGTKEKVPLDLNHAIESTITVARNEWKYVAEMETDFDPSLPPIPCYAGEFNQVILNLIVNAAHAIADTLQPGGPEKGKITIQTRDHAEWAEIRLQDNGSGIPEKLRNRIFDPFFTTKEIGKGTGQGLAIARSVVVDKQGGTIRFESEEGKGTVFIIRLPHDGKDLATKEDVA
jgi:PAS domain S-box-containing protein